MLPIAGEIVMWAGELTAANAQKLEAAGWLPCDGRSVPRAKYADLFAAIGTKYEDGQVSIPENFFLPDFGGRSPIGANAAQKGGRSVRAVGKSVGEEMHTLTVEEMPSHSHRTPAYTGTDGDHTRRDNGLFGATTGGTEAAGGGQPHSNMQPSLIVSFLIRFRSG